MKAALLTGRAGPLAAGQGQAVTSTFRGGKKGFSDSSQPKAPSRDAADLQGLAEAQPALGPLQPNITLPLDAAGAAKRSGDHIGVGSEMLRLLTRRSIVWRGNGGVRRKGPAHQATAAVLGADGIQSKVVMAILCLSCSRGAPIALFTPSAASPGPLQHLPGAKRSEKVLGATAGSPGDGGGDRDHGAEPRGKALGISLPHLFESF